MMSVGRVLGVTVCVAVLTQLSLAEQVKVEALQRIPGAKPRNVIFILTDDHRWDAFGFMGHPFLETPQMDRLAREGVHCANAFVTTSLCSPSRASILTGLYAHNHRVINNNEPLPPGLIYFPQYLQKAGYQTAFIGKWHMGHTDDSPKPGFDFWLSFRGQGFYNSPRPNYTLNLNGKRVPQTDYITDFLTDHAIEWLKQRDRSRPFFLYLSHKAVHGPFEPAKRHRGRYVGRAMPKPVTLHDTPANYLLKPRWVRDQRNSWHGVDFPYHGRLGSLEELYRRYCETLLAVDESVGRIMDYVKQEGILDSTVIMYMGDNGFGWGEHGLIDKRTAYEWSMRVPLLVRCPDLFRPGTKLEQVVANIDIAPTILELAGLRPPKHMDGRSFLPLLRGDDVAWRDALLYEYYWERNFPHTPTMHALRTDRFKYIHYYGIWDVDELYDLKNDPHERVNLAYDPKYRSVVQQLNRRLFEVLEQTGGMYIPLYRDRGGQLNLRSPEGREAAAFPNPLLAPSVPDRRR